MKLRKKNLKLLKKNHIYHDSMELLKEASSGDSTGRLYQINK